MPIRYRPIETWVDPVTDPRGPSPFSASWTDTVDKLRHEVGALSSVRDPEIVIQLDVADRDIRQDGGLRASYRLRSPGVIVSFDSVHGPLRYACDAFDTYQHNSEAWKQNVRAVALGLESLRRVSRYRIGRGTEQYTGFAALGSGMPMPPAPGVRMSEADAAMLLTRWGGGTIFDIHSDRRDVDAVKRAYRNAAAVLHPDNRETGDPVLFRQITDARDVLLDS